MEAPRGGPGDGWAVAARSRRARPGAARGGAPVEASLSEAALREERARYFTEACALAEDLHARWSRTPPVWNPPTGLPDLEPLIRFRYVHCEGLPSG